MVRRWKPIFAALLFAVALAVRITYSGALAADGAYTLTGDEQSYDSIAERLVGGHGYVNWHEGVDYPTAKRTPLYPLFLAGVYWIFGVHDFAAARVAQSVLGSLTCVAAFALGLRLFGPAPGAIAGIWAAFYPPLLRLDSILYSETLFALLTSLTALIVLQAARRGGLRSALLAGAVAGLAAVARPTGSVLLVALLGAMAAAPRRTLGWNGRLALAAASLAGFTVVMAPWVARNFILFDAFVPGTTEFGTTLLGVHNDATLTNPDFRGVWISPGRLEQYRDLEVTGQYTMTEVEADRIRTREAFAWIAAHRDALPRMLWWKWRSFWSMHAPGWDLSHWVYPATLLLAAVGAWLRRSRWPDMAFFYLVMAGISLLTLVFYGADRFRAPFEPALILLAASAVASAVRAFSRADLRFQLPGRWLSAACR